MTSSAFISSKTLCLKTILNKFSIKSVKRVKSYVRLKTKALESGISGSFSTFPTGEFMTSSAFISSKLKAFLNQRQVGAGKLSYFLYWYNCWLSHCELIHLTGSGGVGGEHHIPRPSALRARRGLCSSRDIKHLDERIVVWKYSGWYNYASGKQREVKAFKPEAVALFQSIKSTGYEIPADICRKFYHDALSCETSGIRARVEELVPKVQGLLARASGVVRNFYNNTVKSPFRWYHPLQNTKRELQPILFKGCTNIDVVSCWLSLYWFEMGGKDTRGPDFHFLLNPYLKADLEAKIVEDFKVSLKEAKMLRNNLTMCNKNGHVTQSRVEWYDELHKWVVSHVRSWAAENLPWKWHEITPYRVFTFLEMKLIDKLISYGDPLLRMHDGVIFSSVDAEALSSAAYPHKIKFERYPDTAPI